MPDPSGIFDDLVAPPVKTSTAPSGLFDDLVAEPDTTPVDDGGDRTPDGIGGFLSGLFPGVAKTVDQIGLGREAAVMEASRGLNGALDAARVPLAGQTRGQTLDEMNQDVANAQRRLDSTGAVADNVFGLVPWALPGGQALGGTIGAGNRRLDTLERLAPGGDPLQATAGQEAAADAAGVAQGAIDVFAPKVAGAVIGKSAGALGQAIGGRLGAAAEHAATGAATGETLSLGSAGISAATGDTDRAAAEAGGAAKSGLILGALGGVSGAAMGGSPEAMRVEAGARGAEPAAAAEPKPTGVFSDLVETAPEALAEPTTAAPSGVFDDLVGRTPVAEGQRLDDVEGLRNRAAANARGELDAPKPSAEEPTPIMGNPVLPETGAPNEQVAEAPGQEPVNVQGRAGAPTAEGEGRPDEAGQEVRQPAIADVNGDAGRAGGMEGRQPTVRSTDADPLERPAAERAPQAVAERPTDRPSVVRPGTDVQPAGVGPRAESGAREAPAAGARAPAARPTAESAAERPAAAGGAADAETRRIAARPADRTAKADHSAAGGETPPRLTIDGDVADQRTTSARPDLAIPSHTTAGREAFKAADAERSKAEPAVRSDGDVHEEAAARLANDFAGEHAKLREKLDSGQPLTDTETIMAGHIVDRLANSGDMEEAAKTATAYRVGGGDAARAFRQRADPHEPPPKRAQRETAQRVLEATKEERAAIDAARASGNKKAAKALTDKAAKAAAKRVEDIKKMTGVDPLDLAGEKAAKPDAGTRIRKATLEVDREFGDLISKLKASLKSTSSLGSTGGETVDLLAKIIANRVKRGLLKAADVAIAMARQLPELRTDAKLQAAFKEAWNRDQAEKIDNPAGLFGPAKSDRDIALDKLAKAAARHQQSPEARRAALEAERAGEKARDPEVQAILDTARELDAEVRKRDAAGKPDPTLEQQISAARDKLATAIEKHDEAMGQSDDARRAAIARRGQKPALPPEVQTLLDEAKALGAKVRERDAELKPPKAPPTLDEQLAAARDRLAAATERHAEAMGETPEQRLAKLDEKMKAKEAVHPELKALHAERAALDAQIRARDRKIYLNAMRVDSARHTLSASWWDKEDELWRNGLHTSLLLPEFKIASDVVNRLHTTMADDLLAAIGNHITGAAGKPGAATLADLPHIVRGIIPGLRLGMKMGWDSLRADRNVFSDEVRAAQAESTGATPDEFHQGRALGKVAHALTGWNMRAIGALQAAADSFFARMHVGADAYRTAFDAAGKRLTGDALEEHMRSQMEDLASPAWTAAIDKAHYDTGVAKPGAIGTKIGEIKRSEPTSLIGKVGRQAVRKLAPFHVLPINFLKRGIGMTPLNTAVPLYRGVKSLLGLRYNDGKMTYTRAAFNQDFARSLLSWGATAAIASVMTDDKGRPRITGYGTYNPSDLDVPSPPPHSVRFSDTGRWHDYSRVLGPAAHAVGLITDALHASKTEATNLDALEKIGATLKEHITDEAYLRSIHDLASAVESQGGAAKYLGTFASSYVPTFIKQSAKAGETFRPDRRVKEEGFAARTGQVFEQQIGVHGTPSVDIFGHEIAKDDPIESTTSYVARLLNPANGPKVERDDAQPYRDMIQRWNDKNPDAKMKFDTPEARLTIGKKTVPMTDQQYHDYCVDIGQRTMAILGRVKLNTDEPTARDAQILTRVIKTARTAAHEALRFKVVRDTRRAASTSAAQSDTTKSSPGIPVDPSASP